MKRNELGEGAGVTTRTSRSFINTYSPSRQKEGKPGGAQSPVDIRDFFNEEKLDRLKLKI